MPTYVPTYEDVSPASSRPCLPHVSQNYSRPLRPQRMVTATNVLGLMTPLHTSTPDESSASQVRSFMSVDTATDAPPHMMVAWTGSERAPIMNASNGIHEQTGSSPTVPLTLHILGESAWRQLRRRSACFQCLFR